MEPRIDRPSAPHPARSRSAELAGTLPAAVPAETTAVVRDMLGAAVAVAGQLPAGLETVVLAAARGAFVAWVQVTAVIAAVIAVGVAGVAAATFRPRAGETISEGNDPSLPAATDVPDPAPAHIPGRCGDEVREGAAGARCRTRCMSCDPTPRGLDRVVFVVMPSTRSPTIALDAGRAIMTAASRREHAGRCVRTRDRVR